MARISVAIAVVALLFVSRGADAHMNMAQMKERFEAFKAKFHRTYATPAEEELRFKVFTENMVIAARLQHLNPYASFGENVFADVSAKEFKVYHNADSVKRQVGDNKCPTTRTPESNPPTSIDWRTKGAVTPVKNQGQCGSCWAFSTTGSIEGQWQIAGHNLTSLSEQEIVSCDTIDQGCNGGDPRDAMHWLITKEHGNIATEASYPYKSGGGNTGSCKGHGKTGATITSCEAVQQNEHYMAAWTATYGPLSICIDGNSFQTYNKGILTNCQSTQVDHCVLIVGYDQTNTPPYWIIKNSWGTSWGEEGYIRVEMFKDECLITSEPSSAIVPKA